MYQIRVNSQQSTFKWEPGILHTKISIVEKLFNIYSEGVVSNASLLLYHSKISIEQIQTRQKYQEK